MQKDHLRLRSRPGGGRRLHRSCILIPQAGCRNCSATGWCCQLQLPATRHARKSESLVSMDVMSSVPSMLTNCDSCS